MLFTSSGRCGSVSGLRAGRWFLALPATALEGGSGRSASAGRAGRAGAEPRAARAAGPGLGPTREGAGRPSGSHAVPASAGRSAHVPAATSRAPRGGLRLDPLSGRTPYPHHSPVLRRPTRLSQPEGGSPPPDSNPRCPGDRLPATPGAAQLAQAQAAGARSPPPGTRPQERAAEASGSFPSPEARRRPPPARRGPDFPVPVGRRIAAAPRPLRLPPPPSQQGRPQQARESRRRRWPGGARCISRRGAGRRAARGDKARSSRSSRRTRPLAAVPGTFLRGPGAGPGGAKPSPGRAGPPHQLAAARPLAGGLVEPSERTRVCRDSVAGRHPSL